MIVKISDRRADVAVDFFDPRAASRSGHNITLSEQIRHRVPGVVNVSVTRTIREKSSRAAERLHRHAGIEPAFDDGQNSLLQQNL